MKSDVLEVTTSSSMRSVSCWPLRQTRDGSGPGQWGRSSLKLRCVNGRWVEMENLYSNLKWEQSIKKQELMLRSAQMGSCLWQLTGHTAVGRPLWGCRKEQGRRQCMLGFGPSLNLFFNRAPLPLFFYALRFCSRFNLNEDILLLQRKKNKSKPLTTRMSPPDSINSRHINEQFFLPLPPRKCLLYIKKKITWYINLSSQSQQKILNA